MNLSLSSRNRWIVWRTRVGDSSAPYRRLRSVATRILGLLGSCTVFFVAFCLWSADGRAENQTVIHITYVETHDRLPPVEVRGVEKQHDVIATLSGRNQVTERSTSFNTTLRPNPTREEDSAIIGDNAGHVVWHVLGDRKLQRIFVGQQMLLIMDVDVNNNNQCHVDVKYLEQKGFTDIIAKRADNGELAHFTLPRVKNASCSIE